MPTSRRGLIGPVVIILLLVLAAGAITTGISLGMSGSASKGTAPVALHWSNEGISDLYTLDPAQGPDYNAHQATQLIFGGLVRFGPDFHVLPDVASHWRVSSDGLSYTFFLRYGVRFGDGRPLSASDVAYSLDRIFSPQYAANSGSALLSDIVGASTRTAGRSQRVSGIQVLGPDSLRIDLSHADGSLLAKLANPVGNIVPSWAVQANPNHWDEHAFGTGPFMVSRWIHDSGLNLVPNPYYWAGRIQISGIDMPFFPEPLAAYKRYRSGALDVMGAVHFPPDELFDVQGRADFHRSAQLRTVYLTLNERTPPFNNPWVREALSRALDKRALIRVAYNNFAHPANAMVPPGMPGYDSAFPSTSYNPVEARRLLAVAGYPGGRNLPRITYAVDQDSQAMALAGALATQWRRTLGVRVHLVQSTHTAYLDLLTRLAYQVATIDWSADYPDPQNFVSQLLHSGSSNNNGGWSNQTFDRLTNRADVMTPPNSWKRLSLYHQAQMIAMSQAAVIPLANPYAGILIRNDVQGLQVAGGQVLAQDWTKVRVRGSGGQGG